MIGKRPSATKKIGSVVKKSSKPIADDVEDEVPVTRRVTPTKPQKKVEIEDDFEDDVVKSGAEGEDEDDEDLEDRPPPHRKVTRALALVNADKLGVESFEVEREDMEDESFAAKDRYENMRKNDEKIVVPSSISGGDKNRVRGLTTLFGQRSDALLRLLDSDEDTDGALTMIHRTLLQTMVDVLPVIERGVRRSKGKRGVIPFNQTISQIRELVTDMQAIRDKGMLGASVVERVVRPAYLDLASQVVIAFMEIENSAKNRMSDDDFRSYRDEVLQVVKRSLAQYLQGQYESIKTDVIASLS